jgi:putative two-component system response regulator
MQLHAEAGHRLLADAPDGVLALGAEIALSHHERWDGKGYPRGLSGEAIPVSARIVAVADVFDALTTQRPYKHAWSIQQAVDYIKANAGSHFDPRVVEALQRGLSDVLLAKAAFDARVACAAAATAGLAE